MVLARNLKKNHNHPSSGKKFQILWDALTNQFLVASGDWRVYCSSIP
jgi:hypothetical protein